MGSGTPGMDHTLRDSLMIKVSHFLAENEIFHQCGPTLTRKQRILVIVNSQALIRCEKFPFTVLFVLLKLCLLLVLLCAARLITHSHLLA